MAHDVLALTFVVDPYMFRGNDNSFMARIPSGIPNRHELLSVLAHELKFPDYFGRNWDALYDLLCDLSWIQENQVVIVHSDLPVRLGEDDLRIYLEVLIDAIMSWKQSDGHELVVVFPVTAREGIRSI